ncbi:cobaltochelatase subunit CobN [Thalassotalea marina]|uniref:CobN/magnesium chelatase domain-containing protein n=1 Tax=Thalassotalea marina TaxID=1673741 RepID=A0A919BJM0_9GAMM|nr:cobaltochelatase subunit CobN [Thalassotalea marina]GHF96408.1 hypothetical protein GCM10017161_25960 [Thalassotalea marina]
MIKFIASLIIAWMCCYATNAYSYSDKDASILFISSAHSNKAKVDLLKKIAQQHPIKWQVSHKAASQIKDILAFEQTISDYDIIVLDGVSERESATTFQGYLPIIATTNKHVIAPGWLIEQRAQQGFNDKQQTAFKDYWRNGGRANYSELLNFISKDIANIAAAQQLKIKAPIIFPSKGLYHPEQPNLISNNLDTFYQWRKPQADQAKVALLFNRASIETEQTQLIDQTIAKLEQAGVHVVPFFFKLSRAAQDYKELLYLENSNEINVDLIINFRNIHWANQRKVEFEQFGVPVLQAMTYYAGNTEAWEQDNQGVDAGMMAFTLVLPETAGVTDPMIVAAKDRTTQELQIIDYQLQHLVNKAINLTRLKYKPNPEKKITVFVWGDTDVGASFLNVPQSLSAITTELHGHDYDIPKQPDSFFTDRVKRILDPFYRKLELEALLSDDLAELMPIAEYQAWFSTLPQSLQDQVTSHWGQPQDNFMAIERDGKDYFVLPRMRNGNMLVMRQPPRSDKKNDENGIYHQGIVPINHFYLAAYFYARDYWQSDAIVHLGTHGSQEYLGGKERGLSMFDQGNLAVWDTPVVYPFIVDDVGEAMQTKRRGRATVISHMTPPFAAAGLHGDIAHLHELMHQYKQLDQGGVKQKTAQQIKDTCFDINICKDIGWQNEQIDADFTAFYHALHVHLEELASANQPLGLHTFGQLADLPLLTSTLIQMLGNDFVKLAAAFEHQYFDVASHQHDDQDHNHSFHGDNAQKLKAQTKLVDKSSHQDLEQLSGYQTTLNYIVKPLLKDAQVKQPVSIDDIDQELLAYINKGKGFFNDMRQIRELTSISDFLSGKYIPVKTGGDPIRHPESLATGFNLYGFDPSKVPTQAAFEQGKELINQMISNHVAKHGKYPDKMAFSLWSIETMRHYGVLEAQALYAMGVKPKWSATGRVIGTEIIPYEELKRPRVDVVLSATGLYRDAFPNVMQRLAKAVEQVAALKEESNPIWRNSERIKADLIAQGISDEEASYLSTVRVFSNESGDYGSGTDELAWASDKWETDAVIAENYMNKMGYYFGADRSRWGKKVTDANGAPLNLYGKQLSGTDIALFSRSSNVFGMLSSDDPFEYFGSLSLAVRNLDGKSPDMVVSNLRNATKAKAEDAALFLAKELRTRVFHPRWIKEMQKEGYSGAVSMSSRMDNFFGWQVVDPNLIRSDQWDEFFDVYLDDKLNMELDTWFEKTNPEALARMIERMLEAERKNYWQASPERLQKLVEKYSDFVEKFNLYVDNDKLKDNVTELAQGFGLTAPQFNAQPLEAAAAQSQSNTQQVTGQKLEEQKQVTQSDTDWSMWYSVFGILLIFVFGSLYEYLTGRTKQVNELPLKAKSLKNAA